MRRSMIVLLPLALAVCAASVRPGSAQGERPKVEGEWTGSWGDQSPAQAKPKEGDAPKKANPYSAKLDCKVVALPDGKWEATFEGECGRPYKYTIKMLGRQAGGAVLFQGTVDLGEKDGGVYDWIGRANEKEFVGFYTSQKHVGTFQMARPK